MKIKTLKSFFIFIKYLNNIFNWDLNKLRYYNEIIKILNDIEFFCGFLFIAIFLKSRGKSEQHREFYFLTGRIYHREMIEIASITERKQPNSFFGDGEKV